MKRGWCPGARRPMETGDGLLMRLHPAGGCLTAGQADVAAGVARRCGNGLLDITGRGNLQIRGVGPDTLLEAQRRLDEVGLLEPDRPGPIRPVILSPLAGIDPTDRFDARALGAAIEAALWDVQDLPAKFSVAIDGGGAFPTSIVAADVNVRLTQSGRIALAAARPPSPALPPEGGERMAAAAVMTVLRGLVDEVADFSHLVGEGREGARPSPSTSGGARPSPGSPLEASERAAPAAGVFATRAGAAVLAAAAYGQVSAEGLNAAAALAREEGDGVLRFSFTQGVLLAGLATATTAAVRTALGDAGFVVDPADPRLAIRACAGAPRCSSGLGPVRADADRIARAAPAFFARGGTLHVSGCAKGCASRAPAGLTLVARGNGLYDAVLNGTSHDPAARTLALRAITDMLAVST